MKFALRRIEVLAPYRELFSILGPKSRFQFMLLLAVAVLAAGTQVVGVSSVVPLIALISDPSLVSPGRPLAGIYSDLGFRSFDSFVAAAGVVMIAAVICSSLVNALALWLSLKFAADVRVEISHRLLLNYSCKPYSFFLSSNTAELTRDVLQEVEALQFYFVTPLTTCLVSAATIATVTAALVFVDPVATLASAALFGGGYILIYLFCAKRQTVWGDIRIAHEATRFKSSTELLQGQREARLLNCRQLFLGMFSKATAVSAHASMQATLLSQMPRQGLEVSAFCAVLLLVMYFLYRGQSVTTFLPMLSIYAVAAVRLLPHLQLLFQSVSNIRYSTAIRERLRAELSYTAALPSVQATPLEWADRIELRDLCFRYNNAETDVLSDLNLTVPRNTSIAIVGSTGAGKTTLINILLGLLSPTSGCMKADERVLDDGNLENWQSTLGFVPQDIYLSDDSIAANIAFGRLEGDSCRDRVRDAAVLAQLDDFIRSLPQGYDTLVGERGVRLSGGQRQRLGIARALYLQPSLLILDEATSALDGLTERAVMDAVKCLEQSKTIIIVAHRLSTVRECSQIYIMESGRFVDHGTFNDLMARSETFRAFANASA